MGGNMAALSATVMPRPVGVVPCLAWTSASLTFTEGVLADAIPWDLLSRQLVTRTEFGEQGRETLECMKSFMEKIMKVAFEKETCTNTLQTDVLIFCCNFFETFS